jgi:signal transduction histidine kinase
VSQQSARPGSLVGRLVLWSAALFLVSIPLFWFMYSTAVQQISREVVDTRLLEFGNQLRGHWASVRVASLEQGALTDTRRADSRRFDGAPDIGWVWQVTIGGEAQARSDLLLLEEVALVPSVTEPKSDFAVRMAETPLGPLRLAERVIDEIAPTRTTGERVHYLVGLSADQYQGLVEDHSARLRRLALLAVVPVSLVLLGMLAFIVLAARREMGRMTGALHRYRDGETEQIEGQFSTELQSVVAGMNTLLRQNARLVERTRKYVAKIAHDINHPLAIMKNGLTGEVDRDLMSRQIDRMAGLVDRYSSLARAIGPDGQDSVKTDVATLLQEVAEGYALLYRRTPLTIACTCPPDINLPVPRHDMEAMLSNLLSNAHKYADTGTRISAGNVTGEFWISVEDDGPGIPEADRKAAINWGTRLDEAPPGTGFGLAIVRDIAELHEGVIELGASELGGLKVTIRLPRPN